MMTSHPKQVLHVGSGAYAPEKLHTVFQQDDWTEVRLDIDPDVAPDIVGTVTGMALVADASMDAVYSSHNLEHLYPHEVPIALREFRRVLKPSGFALITMPDLQAVAALIAGGNLSGVAYQSGLGPIAPHDILFGHRPALAAGNLFMAHHTGFTSASLMHALDEAGFTASTVQRVPSAFALWAVAFLVHPGPARLLEAQCQMLPLHAALLAQQAVPVEA